MQAVARNETTNNITVLVHYVLSHTHTNTHTNTYSTQTHRDSDKEKSLISASYTFVSKACLGQDMVTLWI